MLEQSIPVTVMRGGTSRGLFFNADSLPGDSALRDQIIAKAMGSPDPMQIDCLGGGHTLSSKVAIVSKSASNDVDVDYLFLQASAACYIEGSVAHPISNFRNDKAVSEVEHPSGMVEVDIEIENKGNELKIVRSALLRTARKIMQGMVFIPETENQRAEVHQGDHQ